MQKINMDWNEFQNKIEKLALDIRLSDKKYDWIISINRGGVIPGVMLSHCLGIPHGVLTVTHYEGDKMLDEVKKDLYISGVKLIKPHHNILLVDDIADSGICLKESLSTIKRLDSDAQRIDTATVCYKPKSIIKPTYHGIEVGNDTWINFPWESIRIRDVVGV